MRIVEHEILTEDFDQIKINPERSEIQAIELSEPGEEFSLSISSYHDLDKLKYAASLNYQSHLNVETEISQEAFEFYSQIERLSVTEKSPSNIEAKQKLINRLVENFETYYKAGLDHVVIGLSGMSGSGKSTVAREVQKILAEKYDEEYSPIILSTDDYHRGKKYLESIYGSPWINWDDARVYNTKELAGDLRALANGESILKKHFDFDKEEVVLDDIIDPKPFVLIEGLYADSPDLDGLRQAHFEMPTGKATAIGRDLLRLVLENRANGEFGNPASRLKYQLEVAIPTYIESRSHPRNLLFRSLLNASRLVEKPSR